MATDADLVIVGGGPAGTAAALGALARRPAARVVMVDRSGFPRDKACGDGIGPVAVDVLAGLGCLEVLHGAMRVNRLRIGAANGTSVADRVDAPGYVLPRRVFDARLVQAAVDRGAELCREKVSKLTVHANGVVVNGRFRAAAAIGADGVHSRVRREIGAGAHPRQHRAVSLRAYAHAPPREPELVFRLPSDPWPAYAWAFPTGDCRANVGVVLLDGRSPSNSARLRELIAHTLPEWTPLADSFQGHHLPLSPGRPPPGHDRVLLAGDAAGLVNPVSGEGIATALLSGMLAGRLAVAQPARAGRLYRAALGRHLRAHLRQADLASRLMRSPKWTAATIASAGTSPPVFAALAGLTVGTDTMPLEAGARIATQRLRATFRV